MDKSSTGKQQTIDLVYLAKVFKANVLRILIVSLIFSLLFGMYRIFVKSTEYTTEIKFLVNGFAQTDDGLQIDVGQAGDAVNLVKAIPSVIESDRALDAALMQLKNQANQAGSMAYAGYTRSDIRELITKISISDQVVTVKITHEDKQVAMDVAESIEVTLAGVLDYNLGIENETDTETRSSVIKVLNGSGEETTAPTGLGISGYFIVGFAIGFVLIYLYVFLRTYFDCTVYGEQELKQAFADIPVIGQIPTWDHAASTAQKNMGSHYAQKATGASNGTGETEKKDTSNKKKRNPGKKVHGKRTSYTRYDRYETAASDRDYHDRILSKDTPFAISEAFKLLRTNLCYTAQADGCSVYAITSAYVSAGKSLITANAAVSFAQMGKRVLLLDGDLRCPVQHTIFKVDPAVNGLSEVLAGLCEPEDIHIYRPSVICDCLDIVTSGKTPPNPAELLASERMTKLIERFKQEYDVIFIDLPPVCEVSDAGVISHLVTGYSFVVRAGYSDVRVISAAVDTMNGYGASVFGFILNDVDIKLGTYYQSLYYKGYGKYRWSRYGKHNTYGKYLRYGRYNKYSQYTRYHTLSQYDSPDRKAEGRPDEGASEDGLNTGSRPKP